MTELSSASLPKLKMRSQSISRAIQPSHRSSQGPNQYIYTKDVGLNKYIQDTLQSHSETHQQVPRNKNYITEQYMSEKDNEMIEKYLEDMDTFNKL